MHGPYMDPKLKRGRVHHRFAPFLSKELDPLTNSARSARTRPGMCVEFVSFWSRERPPQSWCTGFTKGKTDVRSQKGVCFFQLFSSLSFAIWHSVEHNRFKQHPIQRGVRQPSIGPGHVKMSRRPFAILQALQETAD